MFLFLTLILQFNISKNLAIFLEAFMNFSINKFKLQKKKNSQIWSNVTNVTDYGTFDQGMIHIAWLSHTIYDHRSTF